MLKRLKNIYPSVKCVIFLHRSYKICVGTLYASPKQSAAVGLQPIFMDTGDVRQFIVLKKLSLPKASFAFSLRLVDGFRWQVFSSWIPPLALVSRMRGIAKAMM